MKKTFLITIITALILLLAFGGCNGDHRATNTTKPNTTTTTTTTTQATEEPMDIEIEYEFIGNETQGLIDLIWVKASTITQKVIIDGNVIQLKNAVANVFFTAEFYDASGTLLGTNEQQIVIQGAWQMIDYTFRLTLGIEDPSLVKKCNLVIKAYE